MNNIKKLRIEIGLTQEDIARHLEITLRAYQKIEYGKAIPNVITGLKLAKILQIDPYNLFNIKL